LSQSPTRRATQIRKLTTISTKLWQAGLTPAKGDLGVTFYVPLFRQWLDRHGIENHIVRYVPKRFMHWPPYASLLENLLTNGTLQSISFGRHSCSFGLVC